ncbi:hypothetical protein H7849_11895 [Alloacidobacterium dinghuense]|uniref:DUF2190 domain-containing protein n=1 Tax=Alloacidobacterium dinghuense TaxID=2763107 RepID=A0A7G8BPQ8_9BACT|nr:hypothetical protein [Alloacidobacterium dinghuense]QNI34528.1 hypothetical protein H7849_11895 [Alloacidobacterium dinghuense]
MTNINVELKGPKGPQIKESLLPTALPTARGLAVTYGSDAYHCAIAGVAGEAISGIVEEDAVSLLLPVAVVQHGQTVAQIGAAVTAGQLLATNATGQLIPAVSTNTIVARALESGTNAGDFICVLVVDGGAVHP